MFDIERDVAYINHVSIQSQLSINYESIKKKNIMCRTHKSCNMIQ